MKCLHLPAFCAAIPKYEHRGELYEQNIEAAGDKISKGRRGGGGGRGEGGGRGGRGDAPDAPTMPEGKMVLEKCSLRFPAVPIIPPATPLPDTRLCCGLRWGRPLIHTIPGS